MFAIILVFESEKQVSRRERLREEGLDYSSRDMFFFCLSKEHISTRQNIRWNGECSWGRNARHFIWFRIEEAGLRGREWMLYRRYQEIPLTPSVGTAGGPAWRDQWQAASHSRRPSYEPRPASISLSLSLFAPLPFLLCIPPFELQRSLRMWDPGTTTAGEDSLWVCVGCRPIVLLLRLMDSSRHGRGLWSFATPGFCLIKPYLIVQR